MIVFVACEAAMYSASAVDRAIEGWSLDLHADIEHSPSSFQPSVDELLELEFWQHFGKRVRKIVICLDIG